MSAIRETDVDEPIQVLITMHDNMNLLDFAGPLQVLTHAQHNLNDPGMPNTQCYSQNAPVNSPIHSLLLTRQPTLIGTSTNLL